MKAKCAQLAFLICLLGGWCSAQSLLFIVPAATAVYIDRGISVGVFNTSANEVALTYLYNGGGGSYEVTVPAFSLWKHSIPAAYTVMHLFETNYPGSNFGTYIVEPWTNPTGPQVKCLLNTGDNVANSGSSPYTTSIPIRSTAGGFSTVCLNYLSDYGGSYSVQAASTNVIQGDTYWTVPTSAQMVEDVDAYFSYYDNTAGRYIVLSQNPYKLTLKNTTQLTPNFGSQVPRTDGITIYNTTGAMRLYEVHYDDNSTPPVRYIDQIFVPATTEYCWTVPAGAGVGANVFIYFWDATYTYKLYEGGYITT